MYEAQNPFPFPISLNQSKNPETKTMEEKRREEEKDDDDDEIICLDSFFLNDNYELTTFTFGSQVVQLLCLQSASKRRSFMEDEVDGEQAEKIAKLRRMENKTSIESPQQQQIHIQEAIEAERISWEAELMEKQKNSGVDAIPKQPLQQKVQQTETYSKKMNPCDYLVMEFEEHKIKYKECCEEKERCGPLLATLTPTAVEVEKADSPDFDLTGQMIWPGAMLLNNYLSKNTDILQGCSIIELGSGVGITGILCSKFCREVLLTDHNEEVLKILKKNIDLQTTSESLGNCAGLAAEILEWANEDHFNKISEHYSSGFDLILGADICFQQCSIPPLFDTVEKLFSLRESNTCKFILAYVSRAKVMDKLVIDEAARHGMQVSEVADTRTVIRNHEGVIYEITLQ